MQRCLSFIFWRYFNAMILAELKNKKTLSFTSFYRSCRFVMLTGINPTDEGGKFRSWVFATDRWNSLEQCNPYISISDNLFRRIFDESGIRRRYIEKKSFFGRNLRSIRLWILWYFCGEYTFYKLVSDHIWMNYHKI